MKIIVKVYQNDHSPPSKHNTYTPLQKWFSRPETGTCPSFTERLCLHVNHLSCKARWGPMFSGGAFLFSCTYVFLTRYLFDFPTQYDHHMIHFIKTSVHILKYCSFRNYLNPWCKVGKTRIYKSELRNMARFSANFKGHYISKKNWNSHFFQKTNQTWEKISWELLE